MPHLIGVDQLGGIGCVEGIAHGRQNFSEVLNDKGVLAQVFIGSKKALTGEAVFFGVGATCSRASQGIGGDHVTPLFHQHLRGSAHQHGAVIAGRGQIRGKAIAVVG